MALKDNDDRNTNFDDETAEYEQEMYDAETFRERLHNPSEEDDGILTEPMSDSLEDDFGESINADSNPHLTDQLDDKDLRSEAEADYTRASQEPPEVPATDWADHDKKP